MSVIRVQIASHAYSLRESPATRGIPGYTLGKSILLSGKYSAFFNPSKHKHHSIFVTTLLFLRFLCTFATENKNINHHETTYFIIDTLHTRPA